MKWLRKHLAFGIRLVGFIWSLPTRVMYDLSDLIKNKEDVFDF